MKFAGLKTGIALLCAVMLCAFETDLLAQCAPGRTAAELTIFSGGFGPEVSWEIDSAGTIVYSTTAGDYPDDNVTYGPTFLLQHQMCLTSNTSYTFSAFDSFGDGWNSGTYTLVEPCSGNILANNGGNTPSNGVGTGGSAELETTELFLVIPPDSLDASISVISSPTNPITAGSNAVSVTLSNMGSDTLFTVSINWTVGGVLQTPFLFSSALPPCGSDTVNLMIGSANFSAGQTEVCSWTSMPNNGTDQNPSNDTTCVQLCTPYSGTLTVDAGSPASGTNFQTFNDLISVISTCGINSAITVNVVPGSGPYSEQVIFPSIPGASAINTIRINGNGNAIEFAPGSSDKRVVGFDGAKHITLDSITIRTTSTTYGYGIHLQNESDSNTVQYCTIDLGTITSTSTTNSGGIISSGSNTSPTTDGDNANHCVFKHNAIIGSAGGGAYYGIYLNGQGTGADCFGNEISWNRIEDFRSAGIYLDEADSTQVLHNDIARPNRTSITTFYGIRLQGKTQQTTVHANSIHSPAGGALTNTGTSYGIYSSSVDADVGKVNVFVNNIIFDMNSNGTVYGIYNSSSNGSYYYHNTISLDDQNSTASGTTRGFYQTTTASDIELINNIISITRSGTGTKHAIYLNASGSTVISDQNVLYVNAPGPNHIGRFPSTDFTELSNWQTANGAVYDQNSSEANPNFTNPAAGNFSPGSPLINDIGTNLGVPVDFNDSSRSATPDPGALEFTPLDYDAGVVGFDGIVPPLAAGLTEIFLSIENFSGNTLDTVTVTVDIFDGNTTSTLGPLLLTGGNVPPGTIVDSVSAGFFNFTAGQYDLTAYTSLPNNKVDQNFVNDTSFISVCVGMSGAYTIDANSITGGTNFSSFNDLRFALECGGVLGPVTVDVMQGSGPYNEQFILTSVQGTSSTNTITINGNGETLSHSPNASDKRIIGLDGTSHVTFDSLRVTSGSATYGYGFHFLNNSDSNTVRNCEIDLSGITSATSTNSGGIVASASLTSTSSDGFNAQALTIENNFIHGGASGGPYYGIYLNGTSGGLSAGNTLSDNIIEDFYSYGIFLDKMEDNDIANNNISRPNRASITTFNGIYLTGNSENNLIESNEIHNNSGGSTTSTSSAYGIYFTSNDASLGNENMAVNNLVYDINSNGIVYGIYNSSSNGAYYYHNTISIDNGAATTGSATRGFYQTTTASNIEFVNNLIFITRGGTGTKNGIYLGSTGSTILADHNAIHVNAANAHVGYYSGNQTSLQDWQAANGGIYGQNSVAAPPLFADLANDDLTPTALAVNNIGDNLGILLDAAGASRDPLTPDPGALEFTPPDNDVGVIAVSGIDLFGRANTSTSLSSTEVLSADVHNYGALAQSNVTVKFTVGAQTGTEVIAGPIQPGDTASVTFASTIDLSIGGTYDIQVFTELVGDQNLGNDTTAQETNVLLNDPVSLPFVEDFESADPITVQDTVFGLPGIDRFDYDPEVPGSSRLQTTAPSGGNTSGAQAVTLDRNPSGAVVSNFLTYTVNMTNYSPNDSIVLDFNYTDHGEENHDGDSVWIRGSDIDPWIGLYDLYTNRVSNGTKFETDLDLAGVLAINAQTFSSSFQIRFGQEDNFPIGSDGWTFDDIVIREVTPIDLGVISIDSLASGCGLGMEGIAVTIENFGSQTLTPGTNIAVAYSDGTNTVNDGFVLMNPLTTGGTVAHIFSTPINMSQTGTYDLLAYSLINGDTGNTLNDTSYLTIVHKPTIDTYPYFETFENGVAGWTEEGTNSSWDFGTPNKIVIQGAASGSNAWSTGGLGTGLYNANEDSWIEGPCFDFTNAPANPWVTLKIWVESEFSWDGAVLQQSIDDGQSWTNVGSLGDPNNWYNDGSIGGNPGGQVIGWTGRDGTGTNGWVIAKHPLDTAVLNGQPLVKFRVAFGSDNSVLDDGFAFDDFGIAEPPAVDLGIDSMVCSGFDLEDPNLETLGTFLWSTGATTASITLENMGTAPDTQQITLTYTDTIGLCTVDTIEIIVNPLPEIALTAATYIGGFNVSCNGLSDGSITGLSSNGDGAYSYAWTGPNSFSSAVGSPGSLEAGTYAVTISDGNTCSSTNTISLTEPDVLASTATAATFNGGVNISCSGESDGSVSLAITGGNSGYSYSWTGPNSFASTNQNLTALLAGVYDVTVTDTNGCTATEPITLVEPDPLATSAVAATFTGGDNVSCNGVSDGSLTLTVTGGTASFSYNWSGPNGFSSSDQNPSGLAAGAYDVTVTDDNGCTTSTSITLTEPAVVTATAGSATFNGGVNVSCRGGSDGAISLAVAGGHATYSYAWTGPNSYASTDQNPNSLEAGTYDVTVTDANGCTATESIILTEPSDNLDGSLTTATYNGGVNISCNGLSDGSITTVTTGGTSPYLHSWTGPNSYASSTESPGTLEAGAYQLLLTDVNGCTFDNAITLTEPDLLVAGGTAATYNGGVNISCNGESDGSISLAVMGGTAAYTYAWSGPNNYSSVDQNLAALEAGSFDVIVTDDNGCTATENVVLSQPDPLAATNTPATYVGGANTSCINASDGSIALTTTGGTAAYTYSWIGPNSFASTDQNPSALEEGSYDVTITDDNGCTTTDNAVLVDPATQVSVELLAQTVAGGFNISCTGASDGNITSTPVDGVAGYSYSWSGPSGYSSTNSDPDMLIAGSYFVTITDTNGCTNTNSISLTEPANSISATAAAATYNGGVNISCQGANDGSASVSINGGTPNFTYDWAGPNSYSSINAIPTNLEVGTYDVTVTDANGCTAGSSITLTEPAAAVSATATPALFNGGVNISCNGESDGSIALAVAGGTAGYTYSWTGPASYTSSDQNPASLLAGAYNVVVTDTNGCTANASASLIEPTALSGSSTSPTFLGGLNVSCNAATDGSIDLSVNGGTMAYTYSWTGPNAFASNAEDPGSLEAGSYDVTITDDNGCTALNSITLTQPATPLASAATSVTYNGAVNVSCFGLSDGSIDLTVSGGGPLTFYSYTWTGPNAFNSSNEDPSGVEAGQYDVTVTDVNGCTSSTNINLTEPADLLGTTASPTFVGGNNVSCNGLTDGEIALGVNGGTTPYNFGWTGPGGFTSSTQDPNNLGAGAYAVVVTDDNGCTTAAAITLTEPNPLVATLDSVSTYIGGANVSCNGFANGSITASATGGIIGYQYSWTGAAASSTTADITNIGTGIYDFLVIDTNNCMDSLTVTLTEPDSLLSFVIGTNVNCEGDSTGSAIVDLTGGTETFAYLWDDATGQTTAQAANLPEDTYTVTVTDANGCTNVNSTFVDTDHQLPLISLGQDTMTLYSDPLAITPGSGFSAYLWQDGSFDSTFTATESGIYSVVVTDSNGCIGSDSIEITIWPTGIEETAKSIDVTYFPNPTNGLINLKATGLQGEDVLLEISTINGQVIQTERIFNASETLMHSFNLQVRAQGMYFIRLTASDRSIVHRISVK